VEEHTGSCHVRLIGFGQGLLGVQGSTLPGSPAAYGHVVVAGPLLASRLD